MPRDELQRLLLIMRVCGDVASRNRLLSFGLPVSAIDQARKHGLLYSVRRGIYATSDADLDQLRAITLGGRVACLSALRRQRVWAGVDTRLHVCVTRSAHDLRVKESSTSGRDTTTRRTDSNFVADPGRPRVHWQRRPLPSLDTLAHERDWLMPPLLSLREAVKCQPEEHAIASIDSALRTGLVRASELPALFENLPSRLHHLRNEIDPSADSGNESIVRVRLRRAGFLVTPQFALPGSSRFDLLIDGVVTLDVDSTQFHTGGQQISWDFDKVLTSFGQGVPSLRILPRHIYQLWPQTLAVIGRTVSAALELKHLRGLSLR